MAALSNWMRGLDHDAYIAVVGQAVREYPALRLTHTWVTVLGGRRHASIGAEQIYSGEDRDLEVQWHDDTGWTRTGKEARRTCWWPAASSLLRPPLPADRASPGVHGFVVPVVRR